MAAPMGGPECTEAVWKTYVDSVIWDRLIGLTAEAEDAFGDLLATFFREAADRLGKLRAAAEYGTYHTVAGLGHSLRGSSASMGATAVAHRCAVLEAAARKQDPAGVIRAVDKLAASLDETVALVATRVPGSAARKLMEAWQR